MKRKDWTHSLGSRVTWAAREKEARREDHRVMVTQGMRVPGVWFPRIVAFSGETLGP